MPTLDVSELNIVLSILGTHQIKSIPPITI